MTRAAALLPALALAAFAQPAHAQEEPSVDERIVTRVFDENAVVTIRGKVKVQTTLKFAEDELIENVAIGDSQAWMVQPNKAQKILFVKPLAPNATTNMTVVTTKRTYLFDLVASPRNNPLYVLQFRYPKLEKAKEEARLAAAAQAEAEANRQRASAAEMRVATDPYAVQDPAMLNWEWAKAGETKLLPTRVYDNGEAVFLTWPADSPVPAILILNEDGEEGPVNSTTRGETIVIDMVPAQIILRSGKETATLTNMAPTGGAERSARASDKDGRGS